MRRSLTRILCLVMLSLVGLAAAAPTPPAPPPRLATASPSLLLVASRQLRSPGFRETVILVTRHGRGGPIGVILNRPLEISLKRLFPEVPEADKYRLHEGGPVERGQISYLFRGGDAVAGTLEVAEQTFIARSP